MSSRQLRLRCTESLLRPEHEPEALMWEGCRRHSQIYGTESRQKELSRRASEVEVSSAFFDGMPVKTAA